MYSFIVNSINPSNLSRLEDSIGRQLSPIEWELVHIADASGMCEGYNRGFSKARGDKIIFCHDDIEFVTTDLSQKLSICFESSDVFGVLGTRLTLGVNFNSAGMPHVVGMIIVEDTDTSNSLIVPGIDGLMMAGVQSLDGVLIGCHRHVAESIPWDEETFKGWHGYDADFSYRAYREGFNLCVTTELPIIHYTKSTFHTKEFLDAEILFLKKYKNLKNLNCKTYQSRGMAYSMPKNIRDASQIIESNYEIFFRDCAAFRYTNLFSKVSS